MGMGYMLSNEAYWDRLKDIIPQFKLKYSLGQVGTTRLPVHKIGSSSYQT